MTKNAQIIFNNQSVNHDLTSFLILHENKIDNTLYLAFN